MYYMDATLHGMGGSITDEKEASLRKTLDQDIQPSILETLNLEVQDKLDLREWRLAVVESAVLFETYLNTFLRNVYKTKGLTEAQVEDKFHKNDKYKTPLFAFAIAKNLVKDATGYDFESTTEFTSWATNTKDLRNEIVHGKKFSVTQEEANLSYESVLKAIESINTNK